MDRIHRLKHRHSVKLSAIRQKNDCDKVIVFYHSSNDEKRIELDADSVNSRILNSNMPDNCEKVSIRYVDDTGRIIYGEISTSMIEGENEPLQEELSGITPLPVNQTIAVYKLQRDMQLQGILNEVDKKELSRQLLEKEKELGRIEQENKELKDKNKKLKKKLKEKEDVEWYADVATKSAPLGKIVASLFPDTRLGQALSGLEEKNEEKKEEKKEENKFIIEIKEFLKGLQEAKKEKEIEDIYKLICDYFEKQ